jgi:hypothetical protein
MQRDQFEVGQDETTYVVLVKYEASVITPRDFFSVVQGPGKWHDSTLIWSYGINTVSPTH